MEEEQEKKEQYEEQGQLTDQDSQLIRLLRVNDP